ncbi:MAG: hypothetical protein J7L15_04245 [Clostridiales bacterium]|nr:hypothetical protein [Clostridiales bacterium]
MPNLPKIPIKLKNGDENFTFDNKKLNLELIDFWRWSVSDIESNATRGHLAEFIVATALDIDLTIPREEWNLYDLISPVGLKIEVKCSAYLQSWAQSDYSTISYSIKATHALDPTTNKYDEVAKRHVDIYVFCLLKHKDQNTLDPLNLDQWEFYVLPVKEINNYERSKTSITLNSLKKLTDPVSYDGLREKVLEYK